MSTRENIRLIARTPLNDGAARVTFLITKHYPRLITSGLGDDF